MTKTNAMRILDKNNVVYDIYSNDSKDKLVKGISVAEKIGKDVNQVYKTLVCKGRTQIYVFIIPVHKELDFKKAAKITNEKKIELVNVKSIMKLTGYVRGGCSPIGMKKQYNTFIQEDNFGLEKIIVNAGKIGLYIEIQLNDLAQIVNAPFVDIVKNHTN